MNVEFDITENDLLSLGFKRNEVSLEESGDIPFIYFTFDVEGDGSFPERSILITNDDSNCVGGMYAVEFFNEENMGKITTMKVLTQLIDILNNLVKF